MAAPVKMLQTNVSHDEDEDDDDVDSDEDSSSSEEEGEVTSWGKIYRSLQVTNQSRENLNSQLVFHMASGAVLHGDFMSAVNLYSLGLNCACKEYQQKAGSLESERKIKQIQIAVDKRKLRYALEGCAQDNEKLSSKEFRQRLSKILDEVVEYCDILSLMDFTLLQAVASLYFSLKDKQKAFHLLARDLHLNPKSLSLHEMFENICCHLVERWHFVMLNDKGRNRAYQQAIESVLAQMDGQAVVCDVGCGTGLLSLIACQQLNSGQIFAIEKSNSMCEVAHSVFSANLEPAKSGMITLINKMSSQMSVPGDIPHRTDVLVTETFDAGLFGEGILPTLCHAWSHLIKNSPTERGQVIPGRAELYLQAVQCGAVLKESRFLGQFVGISTSGIHIYGFTGLCELDPYTAHDLKNLPGGYRTLSEPLKFMDVDFNNPEELSCLNNGKIQETKLEVSSSGRLDAIAVWFSLHLNDRVEIQTHTSCNSCWEQAIFPVHPVKVQTQPLSRGPACDLNVQAGDTLKVVNGLVGTKLCMEVSAILKPDEANISCNPHVPQFLHEPDVWQAQSIYCLPCKEVKVLNNMSLNSVQHTRMQELFALMKKDNSGVDFIHLNDGFSPLCLQALKCGFQQASLWVHDQCQGALLQRLVTLNDIDAQKLKVIEDTGDGKSVLASEQGCDNTETLPLSNTLASCGRDVVVMCDLVDTHGRLIEGLRCQEEVLRHHLSSYVRKVVAPCRVDVYGVLVDSEHLLRLSRVQSDENTLGFNIGQFINKYTTRNHQDISVETLPHTKLSEPFKMFTIDMYKLFGIPELDATAEVTTLSEVADACPEMHQKDCLSSLNSFKQRADINCTSLSNPQLGRGRDLSELYQVPCCMSDPGSSAQTQNISTAAESATLAESESLSPGICGTDLPQGASSGFKADRNHGRSQRQRVFQQNETSDTVFKQEPVLVDTLGSIAHTELILESVSECSTGQLSVKEKPKRSSVNDKAESSKECDRMRNKKRSSNCQQQDEVAADGRSSPDRKRGRLGSVDGDEGSDASLDCDSNSENGELSQSVHLKVPIVKSGHVTALIYWFDLHISPTCSISTNDPAHHWNQAAVMSVPSQTQNVAPRDILSLFCQINGSAISFLIE